jgi:hypothetical protein
MTRLEGKLDEAMGVSIVLRSEALHRRLPAER